MQALTFIFAFVAVLALILLVAWLVRRFAGNRLGTTANRGRMPRLAVIDAAAVDGRRRLVLVRRDNVEHLLMIGGPTDVVVESNIVRAASAREQIAQRPGLAAESPPRIAPLPDAQLWPESEAAKADGLDHPEPAVTPMPELPTRPLRPAFGDDGRRPMPPLAERSERRGEPREMPERREPMTGFVPEPLPGRPEPRHELRGEPRMEPRAPEPRPERMMPRAEPAREPMAREPIMPRPLRPAEPPKPTEPFRPQAAELPVKPPPMRAPAPERIPAPERAAAPPPPLPPVPPAASAPPAQSAEANLAEMAQRLEAALRRPPAEPAAAVAPAPAEPPLRPAPRAEPPAPPAAPAPKTSFENLEDEMASLLGRPKSSS